MRPAAFRQTAGCLTRAGRAYPAPTGRHCQSTGRRRILSTHPALRGHLSPKGEGKGYLYPVICRVPSRLLQQQRLDLHAAQRGL